MVDKSTTTLGRMTRRASLPQSGASPVGFASGRNYSSQVVFKQTMNKLIAIVMSATGAVATTAVAATYSTEATMSVQKNEGTYKVVVRVSQLVEQDGKLTEQLIAEPRITSTPGVPASLYSGLQPANPNYANKENVSVDVSWPYPNESGTALCAVLVKRGDKVVSKSRLQLKVEGPGRIPFIVTAKDVDPKSVRVVDEKSKTYILVEFTDKTKEEVKKLANENYGNKVQVRDLQGGVTEGGFSFGTYNEIGLTLHYESKDEAEHVANILRGENRK